MKYKVLLVDDDKVFNEMLTEALSEEGYVVRSELTFSGALKAIKEELFDCALLDIKLPDGNGTELIGPARDYGAAVVIMSAHGDISAAVESVKLGAFNFLEKPFDLTHALIEISRAIEFSEMAKERDTLLERHAGEAKGLRRIIGNSHAIRKIRETVRAVAHRNVTVLIEGESGTGKEVVAKAIHDLSKRKKFIAINCGAVPEALFESELFGHEKGSFTGADRLKRGWIEEADRGTLFLDEISELPLHMQVKFLRVIESGFIQRVGANTSTKIDTRIICATNRNLSKLVEEKKFRDDLYYRIKVIGIEIPPLRERPEDVEPLVKHFTAGIVKELGLSEAPEITTEFISCLASTQMPGNARELRNTILSIMAMNSDLRRLEPELLPSEMITETSEDPASIPSGLTLDEMERRYVLQILERNNWNKTRTADVLGISKSTLYDRLKRWNIT